MTIRQPNYALLRKIRDHILEEPKRVDMGKWIRRREDVEKVLYPSTFANFPACGTIACIAGWAVTLGQELDHPIREYVFYAEGKERLRLTDEQAYRLFYTPTWPDIFSQMLAQYTPGTDGYAKVVAARINKFIESRGEV